MADENSVLSINDAVDAVIAEAEPDSKSPDATTEKSAPDALADEQPEPEEQPATAEIDADDEQTDDDEESDDSDDAEDVDAVSIDADSVYVIDGNEYTGQELIAGYERASDYTQKTQRLADERKAVAESAQYVDDERKAVTDLMPRLQAYEQALLPVFQMGQNLHNQMANMTPEQQQVAQMVLSQLGQASSGAQDAIGKMKSAMDKAGSARQKDSLARLKRYNPDWGPDVYGDVKAHAMSHFGYSAEQVDRLDDWRIMQAVAESLELTKLKTSAKTKPKAKDPVKLSSKKRRASSIKQTELKQAATRAKGAKGLHNQLDAYSDFLVTEAGSKRR